MTRRLMMTWLASLALVPAGWAQQNSPHIGFVYPAGGRRGDTFQVEVGGQFLDNVANVSVSGGGVQATVVELTRPLPPQQVAALRDQIQELQKKERDAATLGEIAGIREKIAASVNRNANPALAQRAILRITVAADAEPGERELRLVNPLGVSNPLVFCIGQLPEFKEKEPKNSPADAVTDITLPATLNGRIVPGSVGQYRLVVRQQQPYVPGDVDRYRFAARKGQRLVVAVKARELMPYLADAVPGWFQAAVTVYDEDGNELAYDDDYRFHPDPVLSCEIPRDGNYIIEIGNIVRIYECIAETLGNSMEIMAKIQPFKIYDLSFRQYFHDFCLSSRLHNQPPSKSARRKPVAMYGQFRISRHNKPVR